MAGGKKLPPPEGDPEFPPLPEPEPPEPEPEIPPPPVGGVPAAALRVRADSGEAGAANAAAGATIALRPTTAAPAQRKTTCRGDEQLIRRDSRTKRGIT